MTGFDLPQNFHSNPESLLRRVRPRIVPPQISLSAAEPVIASSSAPRAMTQKTLRDYSAPSASQVPTGPEVNTEGENFEIKTGLITMVQPALSVARPMRMPALISISSWNFAPLLLSREYLRMRSGSVCYRSLSCGERSNGSMLTRPLWTPGTNVLRCSSRSSSQQAKPMLFTEGF